MVDELNSFKALASRNQQRPAHAPAPVGKASPSNSGAFGADITNTLNGPPSAGLASAPSGPSARTRSTASQQQTQPSSNSSNLFFVPAGGQQGSLTSPSPIATNTPGPAPKRKAPSNNNNNNHSNTVEVAGPAGKTRRVRLDSPITSFTRTALTNNAFVLYLCLFICVCVCVMFREWRQELRPKSPPPGQGAASCLRLGPSIPRAPP